MKQQVKISKVKGNPDNPRIIKNDKFKKLVKSIQEFPEMLKLRPIVVDEDFMVLGGNMRLKASKDAGLKEVWIEIAEGLTEEQKKEFIVKDNVGFGEWEWDMLANEWDSVQLAEWGLDVWENEDDVKYDKPKKLSERFIIPPFSVLDTKQGAWQQRKNYWLSLGIKSELGRNTPVNCSLKPFKGNPDRFEDKLTSIFDPVLCELSYQWFNIPNGNILDPFAGGSVRGIVASKLGFNYFGNDLSSMQIEANKINAKEVLQEEDIYPTWTNGDSLNIDKLAKDYKADMIFSCPPYADLEVYSDAKEDISNMEYEDFINTYKEIIRKSCDMLKKDRFAVFVVGDVRDKKGFYKNFVSDTVSSFLSCGVLLYNEMILVNQIGNLPMRVGRAFSAGRKVGKQHQNVLVFYKGNPKNIKANYPELDLSYINDIEY